MEKKLKDYLHLYLGCAVIHESLLQGRIIGIEQPDTAYIEIDNDGLSAGHTVWDIAALKPLLRHLESMTEEQAIELCKLVTDERRHDAIGIFEITEKQIWYIDGTRWQSHGVDEMADQYIIFSQLHPEQMRYLLSERFDLFGLIDAGLAIEAATLNKNRPEGDK